MVDMSNLLNLQTTIFCLMMAGYILTKLHVLNRDSRKHLSDLLINFILPCNILVSFMIEFIFHIQPPIGKICKKRICRLYIMIQYDYITFSRRCTYPFSTKPQKMKRIYKKA